MKRIYIFFFFILTAFYAHSYRYICDGILANGETHADKCGVCNTERAARWESPNIPVVIDKTVLPKGLKRADWEKVVKNSFAAWEEVSGSNLKFIELDRKAERHFGVDESTHEIFWITDRQEWRKLVGMGEFGTLGATLPRYSCSEAIDDKRVIFDADLVLNGLPGHINWQLECYDEDCASIQTTLVHELGHFFGLDHPCLSCNTSIMSARAGYDLTHPTLDDMDGLRALYPGGEMGGFGHPCSDDEDCDEKHRCLTEASHNYCSKECKDPKDCEFGAECKTFKMSRLCSLSVAERKPGKKEGESCSRAACEEPLVCAAASDPNFYCYQSCLSQKTCNKNQECIPLEGGAGACVNIKQKDEVCNHRDLCRDDLYCVFESMKSGFCRMPCLSPHARNKRCFDGEYCKVLEGVEICLPEELELSLDKAVDEFAETKDEDSTKNNANKSEKNKTIFGCQSHYPDKNNDLRMLGMLLFGLWLLRFRDKLLFLK